MALKLAVTDSAYNRTISNEKFLVKLIISIYSSSRLITGVFLCLNEKSLGNYPASQVNMGLGYFTKISI